ncbi:MAG TPA: precorrin-8X methylmutase [Syntrophaceae bacterium]|nr:precorrin-8X methylmutase [Syntrophaceae bacterium]HCX01472.1 precorrin-8X methylmutase [Syntrophaceae bacterium]
MTTKVEKEVARPLIHAFYDAPCDGAAIEARSFEIISREYSARRFSSDEWEVVRRMIHTTGDSSIMETVCFSPGAIDEGKKALKAGRPLYADASMIRAGLSMERLRTACNRYSPADLHCHIADADVAGQAKASGMPRSIHALRKALPVLPDGIVVLGNAPLALLELNRLIVEEGICPALVVAMPVGFVHVCESKEELVSLGIPFITILGRRGGSPLAVSVIHALCTLAALPSGGNNAKAS